ncbi:carbohydrate ABC transporter permease [Paenibacillus sp. PAMC21692]|uniref:carbohydrate ABC transporter permease n=1 Tax=Paenibacillus sp. PAMC21692 TaxID=2762320 RepID=UPI00164D41B5|nr:carbohydrate ABC transporter permease [Paenibacillus sp. PAMC21692]QNK57196.1 carbohydrate ABC transporter permease [Paenibacillus sp. PAMC21692]
MSERVYQWSAAIIVSVISVFSVLPLWYAISSSLVYIQEWNAKGGFILWPDEITLQAYQQMFASTLFTKAMGVTLLRTAMGALLTLAFTVITAYAVSRKKLPGRKVLLLAILITILFGGGLIPTYLVVRDMQLLDSIWALIIPGLVDSWSVLVLKQFFENLPTEVEESAQIDGAGEIQLMWKIMIPMAAPAMAAIGLFTAVGHWNAWFDALIYIDDRKLYPLQLLIRNMFENDREFSIMQNAGAATIIPSISQESLKMALVVYGILPILCVYPFLQKYFTKGMYLGAVKG